MSVFELVGALCSHIFDAEFANEPWNPNLPEIRRKALRRLRSKCFEILLHKDSIPADVSSPFNDSWPAAAQVAGRALELRERGRWGDAARAERCSERLLREGLHTDPTVAAVLELLLRLQDSGPPPEDYEPKVFRLPSSEPWDPLRGPKPYIILHPSVFAPPPWMEQLQRPSPSNHGAAFFPPEGIFPFERAPGQGLRLASRFLRQPAVDGSSLPSYTITPIPLLTEPRIFTVPKLLHERGGRTDEGYATSSNEGSRSVSPEGAVSGGGDGGGDDVFWRRWRDPGTVAAEERARALAENDAIWQRAITYSPRRLRTWESLGSRLPRPEKPFLSEAGQKAADHFLHLIEGFVPGLRFTVSLEELTRDLGYLLLGTHSHTFHFDEDDFSFSLSPGVNVEGLSSEALTAYCSGFLELGTCVCRLQLLCERGVPGHSRTRLFEALREQVQVFLQFHLAVALVLGASAPAPPPVRSKAEAEDAKSRVGTLLALKERVEPLRRRTVTFSRLLGLAPAQPLRFSPDDSYSGPFALPAAAGLLQHLYEAVACEARRDICCIFLSVLRAVCAVYFRFVERWLFEGTLADPWEEFFVTASGRGNLAGGARTRKDWEQGFQVAAGAVPTFLRGLHQDVLTCGRIVYLLRLCCPKTALCMALQSGYPGVPCCLAGQELRGLLRSCRNFEARVRLLDEDSGGNSETRWRPQLGPSEADARRKQETARRAQEQHMLKAKLELEAGRRAVAQKKAAWRQELAEQAQEAAQRREEQHQQQLQEERQLAYAQQLQQEKEDRLRAQERQRIIDYYEELSETAAKRQQLAEWRTRRFALCEQREEFILNERDAWRAAATAANINLGQGVVGSAEQKNFKNAMSSSQLTPLASIEEDAGDIIKPDTEEARATLTLPLAKVAAAGGDTEAAQGTVDNATPGHQQSPNNNTINNNINAIEITTHTGDVNKNMLQHVGKNAALETKRNLLDTTVEDLELGNVPLDHREIKEPTDNDASGNFRNSPCNVIKAKVSKQKFGITQENNSEVIERIELTQQKRVMSAAERNKQKVMEQEFGITSPHPQRPKTVPLRTGRLAGEAPTDNAQHLAAQRAAAKKDFDDTAAQRRANRWNMLQGDTNIITGEHNPLTASAVSVNKEGEDNQEEQGDDSMKEELCGNETTAETLQTTTTTTNATTTLTTVTTTEYVTAEQMVEVTPEEPMLTQETPSEADAPSMKTEESEGVGLRLPKSLSWGSMGVVWRGASGQSSKTSSCYNLASLASSNSFDFGSGRGSLNTPSTEDSTSLDAFKSDSVALCGGGSFAFWRSSRLGAMEHDLSPDGKSPDEPVDSMDGSENVDFTDFTSILVALQKSVAIPLYTQLRLANETALKFYFEDLQLFQHLESLRAFFLLSDGEFACTLTDALFHKMEVVRLPSHLLNYVVLNALLSKALDSTLAATPDDHAKRLSFKVNNTPDHFRLLSVDVVECVGLRYATDWPLNVILTERAILKYNVVFSFLLKLRLVCWRLERCFQRLKWAGGEEVGQTASAQFRCVHLWRHEMTHFARAVQAYVSTTALQEPWDVLHRALVQSSTLDQLYYAHVTYVKKTLYRCLLYKNCNHLQSMLMGTFNIILKFLAQLEASSWRPGAHAGKLTIEHPDFPRLRHLYAKFQQAAALLYRFVQKLVQAGFQTHLHHLLEALNANGYYDRVATNVRVHQSSTSATSAASE